MSARPAPQGPQTALTPCERLGLSRARLREALLARNAPPESGSAAWREAAPGAAALLDGLKALPGVSVVAEALGHWWAQHPLRSVALLSNGALQAVIGPLAKRHPYMLAGGALLVGALLAWGRPWRLARRHGLLAGLGPALVAAAMARVPLQALFGNVLATLLQQLHATQAAADVAAQAASAPAHAGAATGATAQPKAAADGVAATAAPLPQAHAAAPIASYAGSKPATPFPTSAQHPPQAANS